MMNDCGLKVIAFVLSELGRLRYYDSQATFVTWNKLEVFLLKCCSTSDPKSLEQRALARDFPGPLTTVTPGCELPILRTYSGHQSSAQLFAKFKILRCRIMPRKAILQTGWRAECLTGINSGRVRYGIIGGCIFSLGCELSQIQKHFAYQWNSSLGFIHGCINELLRFQIEFEWYRCSSGDTWPIWSKAYLINRKSKIKANHHLQELN